MAAFVTTFALSFAKVSNYCVTRKDFAEIVALKMFNVKICRIMETMFDVKGLRKSLNLSQKDFASRCGVSVRTVQYWESGGTLTQPVVELLKGIASGEGAIFAPISSSGSGVSVAAAVGSSVNVGSETARFLDELAAQRRLTEEVVSQNSRLLSIIEKMQK